MYYRYRYYQGVEDDASKIRAFSAHDAGLVFNFNSETALWLTVTNITNKKPPFIQAPAVGLENTEINKFDAARVASIRFEYKQSATTQKPEAIKELSMQPKKKPTTSTSLLDEVF